MPYDFRVDSNFKEQCWFMRDVLRPSLDSLQSGYILDFIRVSEFVTIRPTGQIFILDSCKGR